MWISVSSVGERAKGRKGSGHCNEMHVTLQMAICRTFVGVGVCAKLDRRTSSLQNLRPKFAVFNFTFFLLSVPRTNQFSDGESGQVFVENCADFQQRAKGRSGRYFFGDYSILWNWRVAVFGFASADAFAE